MHEAGDRLARLRRLDSEVKATRVLAALDAMVITGEPLQVTRVARRAGVSRRFVYDHPELRAEIDRRSAEVADRFATTITAAARVSGASLRADLENARAQNRRLRDRLALLDQRLGETVGDEVRAEMTGRGILANGEDLAPASKPSMTTSHACGPSLPLRSDELEAARQINRELMARLNLERR